MSNERVTCTSEVYTRSCGDQILHITACPFAIRINFIEHTSASGAVNKTSPNTISILVLVKNLLKCANVAKPAWFLHFKASKIGISLNLSTPICLHLSFLSMQYIYPPSLLPHPNSLPLYAPSPFQYLHL